MTVGDRVREKLGETRGYITATVERDISTGDMVLNIGPQHPSTHGVLRVVCRLDGERVVEAEPVIGYMHRAFEKLAEVRSPMQNTALFNRLDWIQGFCCEVPYCIACEELAEIEVPERARVQRVILFELNRIASHSLFCGVYGLELGALTAPMYGYRDREYALDLMEMVTGQRMHTNWCRIGGMKEDFPKGFYERIPPVLEYYRTRVDQWLDFLIGNDIFIKRTRDIGSLPADVALEFGVSGPNLRACGVPMDARKQEAYLGYQDYEFEVPVGDRGDCFDRYVQRVREIWESCNIVEQALEGLPSGPVNTGVGRTFKVPPGEVYIRGEGPRGEMGYYLISRGDREPYRLKIRTGSFSNVSVLSYLLDGVYIPDIVAILGSLDFVVGDIDR
jgi:NADH-quinone oxidoreductase subunit D